MWLNLDQKNNKRANEIGLQIQQIIENSKVNYPKGISVEPTPKTEIKNTKSKTRVTPY